MMKEKIKIKERLKDETGETRRLILHNDNINIYDYVINSLVEVCGHNLQQAEQCTLIAHYKGECEIKTGSFKQLMPCHKELTFRNIIVSID